MKTGKTNKEMVNGSGHYSISNRHNSPKRRQKANLQMKNCLASNNNKFI